MAVVTTKSASITGWDASPMVVPTSGEGGPGWMKTVNDSLGVAIGDSAASLLRFVRVPTNAKIKRLFTTVVGNTGTVSVDIDVAFSSSSVDGTPPQLAGGVVQITGPVDNKLFGSAIAITGTAAIVLAERTFAGTFTAAHQNLPLWQVLVNLGATQFTADPGGFFDLIYKITTAAATAATTHSMQVDYVEGP